MSLRKSLKHFIGGPPNFKRALAFEAEQFKSALERQNLESIRQAMSKPWYWCQMGMLSLIAASARLKFGGPPIKCFRLFLSDVDLINQYLLFIPSGRSLKNGVVRWLGEAESIFHYDI
ncbi:hypothetical protein BC833DRAFT_618331 [Globomyces pollinis-pini]|nr:hypothetical protein BC833DRAFT_618331 [Globomyces pollinis-pini]